MKLKLKSWRRQGQNSLLCPYVDKDPKTGAVKSSGQLHFKEVGEELIVDDKSGYQILTGHSDMLEIVTGASKPVNKAASAPRNK